MKFTLGAIVIAIVIIVCIALAIDIYIENVTLNY